ncbi:MAG: aldolase [Mycetocola sp.]
MNATELRAALVRTAQLLHDGGHSPGTSGNISVRDGNTIIVSPTGARLGSLSADALSVIDLDGTHLDGPRPTKESLFHAAIYRSRPLDRAVVHLHSPFASALSCLEGLNPDDVLPAYTPYFVMRVGVLRLVPYFPPGDEGLAFAIGEAAREGNSLLLANHGSLVSGETLELASATAEEIEETARLHFVLGDRQARVLNSDEIAELRRRYP